MQKNDEIAAHNQEHLTKNGILCINILGAPGSGKTTLIEGIANHIPKDQMCVIQGDCESDIDKKRLESIGIDTYQINTHKGCHLNADMIHNTLHGMDLEGKKYLFIENVGNLVCPAGIKIGQHLNVLVSSVTEGHDKPKKYPYIFMDADIVVLSKHDLKDATEFNEKAYADAVMNINGQMKIVTVSKKDKQSFEQIASLLDNWR